MDLHFLLSRITLMESSATFWFQEYAPHRELLELLSRRYALLGSRASSAGMSSSPEPFRESSPVGDAGCGRSRFSYRQLSQLASYSTSSPLRVIAHIDLDAFYAQCEMVRLGVTEDQPLAVQQWYLLPEPELSDDF